MQIIDEIEKDISLLKSTNNTNDIGNKTQITERLSINSYYLASLVGEWYERKNSTEYMYKSSMSSYIATSTLAVGKAEAMAKNEFKEMFKDHLESDSMYRKLSLLMSQVNVIIEQSRQTISTLKQELRYSNA
jgi:hypothetical protein